MKYTPGPWEVVGRGIYQIEKVGGREVVHGNGIKGRDDKDEAEANAYLMAAGPDLLEACKWALSAERDLPKLIQRRMLQVTLESAINKAERAK